MFFFSCFKSALNSTAKKNKNVSNLSKYKKIAKCLYKMKL